MAKSPNFRLAMNTNSPVPCLAWQWIGTVSCTRLSLPRGSTEFSSSSSSLSERFEEECLRCFVTLTVNEVVSNSWRFSMLRMIPLVTVTNDRSVSQGVVEAERFSYVKKTETKSLWLNFNFSKLNRSHLIHLEFWQCLECTVNILQRQRALKVLWQRNEKETNKTLQCTIKISRVKELSRQIVPLITCYHQSVNQR